MDAKTHNENQLKRALVYLWTRDAGMPVTGDTEEYIAGHLKAITGDTKLAYSDKQRLAMADRIVGGEGNVELRD